MQMDLLTIEGFIGQLSMAALFMVMAWRMSAAHSKTTGQMIEAQKDNSRFHAEVKASADAAFIAALQARDHALVAITDQLTANAVAVRASADASTAIANRMTTLEVKATQSDMLAGRMLTAIEANSHHTADSVLALREMTGQLAPILQATRDTSSTVTALTSTIRETLTEMVKVRQELTDLAKRVNGYASQTDMKDLQKRVGHLTDVLTLALVHDETPPTVDPTDPTNRLH